MAWRTRAETHSLKITVASITSRIVLIRLLGQGAGDAHSLALATRQRIGPLVGMVEQADAVEQPIGAFDVLAGEAPSEAAPEGPIRPMTSPRGTRNDTSRNAASPVAYVLERWWSSSTGAPDSSADMRAVDPPACRRVGTRYWQL